MHTLFFSVNSMHLCINLEKKLIIDKKAVIRVQNENYGFDFLGEGDYVIDQLPRVGEQIEQGQKVKIMLGNKQDIR